MKVKACPIMIISITFTYKARPQIFLTIICKFFDSYLFEFHIITRPVCAHLYVLCGRVVACHLEVSLTRRYLRSSLLSPRISSPYSEISTINQIYKSVILKQYNFLFVRKCFESNSKALKLCLFVDIIYRTRNFYTSVKVVSCQKIMTDLVRKRCEKALKTKYFSYYSKKKGNFVKI